METISEKVLQTVALARPCLLSIPTETARIKPSPADWSRQEILGHLIDSAMNNIQRFVRGGYNAAENFPPYDQERWVEIQEYNDRDWHELINLWVTINQHLCAILDRLTDDQLENLCSINRVAPVTLRYVMEDYPRHMNMHLNDILN